MNRLNKGCNKNGNIFISLGIIVLAIVFSVVFLVYCQVNIIVADAKRELYYVTNNSILSFDFQDLAFKKYTVDENKAKQIIQELLDKNCDKQNSGITKIEIKNLEIINNNDDVKLKIQAKVTFNSVISISGNKQHSFNVNDQISISLLNYKQGE